MTLAKTRVLIVDDHEHAREAIDVILSMDECFEVIGVVTNGQEAVDFMEKWLPDLILMDIQMPVMDGLEATSRIKLMFPYVKIVMITVSDDMLHLLEALKRGAQGYLLKNLEPSTWLEYLHSIIKEEAPLSRDVAYQILKELNVTERRQTEDRLTTRELDILYGVAAGWTNKEIASQYDISE
ncbi:LuxR family two component transcriptional regulator [Paenibacillus illinoisensis]|uniref:LuxR family two component transcriptional regulator n=1 Tax=Paenibacillus illinoisensis TaxID=59845 RepID=A0A2W0CPR8_9BACL|nr:LuxR family two component transcriptional regulator [Paenibacillus illinoisensis]